MKRQWNRGQKTAVAFRAFLSSCGKPPRRTLFKHEIPTTNAATKWIILLVLAGFTWFQAFANEYIDIVEAVGQGNLDAVNRVLYWQSPTTDHAEALLTGGNRRGGPRDTSPGLKRPSCRQPQPFPQ